MEHNGSSSASSTCEDTSISSNSVDSIALPEPTAGSPTAVGTNDAMRSANSGIDYYRGSCSISTTARNQLANTACSGSADTATERSNTSNTSSAPQRHNDRVCMTETILPDATPADAVPPNSTSGGAVNMGTSLITSSSTKKAKDCHEIVKTSALAGERRGNLCTVHQNGIRKTKVNVACQTDPDESVFPKITSQCSRTVAAQPSIPKSLPTPGVTLSAETSAASSSNAADGTLRLMIQNFKNMGDTVRGPSKKIQAVPWRIMVMPRQHVVQKKGTQKCLGFFLQCCPDAYSDSWSCQAAAELRLISQKQGVPHFTRKTNHVYTAKENDWGYSCFMTWADILDESQGYIKEDKVILEVSVKAEPPKNILTHDQFEKKIQDYMRLADIQSSRGLIDKAIEVNLSALKFCKDRDQDCKAELEAQKAKLIEMKLKQSIERIEKGPPTGKCEEENSLNQNALKQAISGTPATMKQSGTTKSGSKFSSSNGKSRDGSTVEKNGGVQPRAQTPPTLPKTTAEAAAPISDTNVTEKRTATQTDKSVCIVPGITTTCKGSSGYSTSSTTTTLTKDSMNSADFSTDILASSPYRAPWTLSSEAEKTKSKTRSTDFGRQLEESMSNDVDRLTTKIDSGSDINRIAAERNAFIMSKQNELVRSRAIRENVSCLTVRNNSLMMNEIKKTANDAYEEELRRQSLKRIAIKSIRDAQLQQKMEGLPNSNDMDNELRELSRLTEDQEVLKMEEMKMNTADPRSKKILRKQMELKNMKLDKDLIQPTNPVWRTPTYKSELTGHRQPWESLCDDGRRTERLLYFSSDDETGSSGGPSSDSEVEGSGGRTALGVPLSKKMKRSLEDQENLAAVLRDECDTCIQQFLDPQIPTHETQETSCQTDFDVAGKPDDAEWRKKKAVDTNDSEALRKKNTNEARSPSEDVVDKMGLSAEMTKENIARITGFANDPKIFQALPPIYHPSPQLFGEELPAPQMQPYLDDSTQPNVWSRQYIEEWLKFNIKYCCKYMKNGENSPASGDESGIDLSTGNIPHFSDAQVQQVMAALSVIGVNCVNAKRVVDKAAEFINTLESRSKSPFLKDCLQKLAVLAGDEKALEASKDARKISDKDSVVDCPVVDDRLPAALCDESDDISAIMSSMECPDDQHDYMLNREVHRIGMFADQAVSKNPLMEVGQAEKLNEHTEKISHRIAALESDKENLTKQLTVEREKFKKAEQKHTNAMKQAQSQLQTEKEKHEKTVQQLNQKKNELKKQEKALKQHERDIERAKELQEKIDYVTKEMQEMRQKHADEVRKLQRELQSSQDTRKNMAEEIRSRDSEIAELRNQLNEKSIALKRSESALCSERKSFQSSLSSAVERARKGEIMYLEQRLEAGVAILERAYKDAGQRVKDFESEQKKASGAHPPDFLKTAISEWKAKREEVASLIASSKAEFASQIEQIKGGKPLSQLPRISVAKPPPAPKSFKISQFSAQTAAPALEKPVTTAPSVGVIGQNSRVTIPQAGVIGTPMSPSSVAPGSPIQNISKAPAPPTTVSPLKSSIAAVSTIAPIGVRPSSHINGSSEFSSSNGGIMASTTTSNQPSTSASSGMTMAAPWASGWDNTIAMSSINELMNPSRSFGPIGTDYGVGNTSSSTQLSQPPPGLATSAAHFGSSQSNGWGNTGCEWSSSMSGGQHAQYNQIQQNVSYQSAQWTSGWTGYHTPQTGGSPDVTNALLDNSRSSSPRRDVLFESLRSHFPNISHETMKEYVSEFMSRSNFTSLKGVSTRDLLHGVEGLIRSKPLLWNKTALPPIMHPPPPSVLVQSPVGLSGIDPYQSPPSRLHNQQTAVHTHVLMQQQQLRDGMEN